MWLALPKIAVILASLLGEINLLTHQVGDQLIWGDHPSTNPKSSTKIYSLMWSFCVWRNIFKLLLISPCWLLLWLHPQRETLPFFLIAALLRWLLSYYFFLIIKEKSAACFSPCLTVLLDRELWNFVVKGNYLKCCFDFQLHLFYRGGFWKARTFFSISCQGNKGNKMLG